ncbi:hypothetical protein DOTSEDRAFT_67476 [Dothistroma septosporum NZE10]|uniref:Uncharacterized protein n=1 Tax=Dothistroma septosporum (strain NZE10 / CBS 128990) TaxID=675120 RepID=N1PZK6_DOTSN|nr:hypothetical protein DOTSEDRAFT_67476 [Dothistroma septosporum NZE10]
MVRGRKSTEMFLQYTQPHEPPQHGTLPSLACCRRRKVKRVWNALRWKAVSTNKTFPVPTLPEQKSSRRLIRHHSTTATTDGSRPVSGPQMTLQIFRARWQRKCNLLLDFLQRCPGSRYIEI